MNDSRIAQARAAIDDARVALAELHDDAHVSDIQSFFLGNARDALNASLEFLHDLEKL